MPVVNITTAAATATVQRFSLADAVTRAAPISDIPEIGGRASSSMFAPAAVTGGIVAGRPGHSTSMRPQIGLNSLSTSPRDLFRMFRANAAAAEEGGGVCVPGVGD